MKALEDLSWPHGRFAKVGGVNESELGRLEVGFCFLMEFSLKMDAHKLTKEAKYLISIANRDTNAIEDEGGGFELKLPDIKNKQAHAGNGREGEPRPQLTPTRSAEKRKASSSLPEIPV
ncbi:hypothetical protein LTR66_017368 [Elasticomyces elasticus]|nr:hypothetical protein LTR66_017368 [Elasticomyces elasticus]